MPLENSESPFDHRDSNRGTVLSCLTHLVSQVGQFSLFRSGGSRRGFRLHAFDVARDGVHFALDLGFDFGDFLLTGQRITRPFYRCLAFRRLSQHDHGTHFGQLPPGHD